MTDENTALSRRDRFALLVRGLGLLVVMGLVAAIIVGRAETLAVGDVAPPLHARSFDGKSWDLSLFDGQPVFVNFWGSWCPPCLAELPSLVEGHRRYGHAVQFVGLTVDSPAADVFAVMKKFDVRYAIAQTDGATVSRWHADMLPTSVLLDAEHRVLWAGSGALSPRDVEALFADVLGVDAKD